MGGSQVILLEVHLFEPWARGGCISYPLDVQTSKIFPEAPYW